MNPMSNLFGNTLRVHSMRGNARLWYDTDGTVSGIDDAGTKLSGTWILDGTRLCTTITAPQPRPPHYGTLEPHAIGDSWEDHRDDGTTTRLSIEPGR